MLQLHTRSVVDSSEIAYSKSDQKIDKAKLT